MSNLRCDGGGGAGADGLGVVAASAGSFIGLRCLLFLLLFKLAKFRLPVPCQFAVGTLLFASILPRFALLCLSEQGCPLWLHCFLTW